MLGPSHASGCAVIDTIARARVLQTQVAFMYLAYVTWGVVGFCGAAVMLIHYIGVLAALAGKGAHSTP